MNQLMGPMLTTNEGAERLRVDPSTLRRWRLDEVGPRFLRIGRLYRYPSDDLEAWISESVRHSVAS
jgi:excisionase family DNA binding protein